MGQLEEHGRVGMAKLSCDVSWIDAGRQRQRRIRVPGLMGVALAQAQATQCAMEVELPLVLDIWPGHPDQALS